MIKLKLSLSKIIDLYYILPEFKISYELFKNLYLYIAIILKMLSRKIGQISRRIQNHLKNSYISNIKPCIN